MTATTQHHPIALTVDRKKGVLSITWADGHESTYRLAWLRAVCPCAACNEERREAASNPLRLMSGPPPSAEIEKAELVGNYAVRFTWSDGHAGGIFGFSALRASCPCPQCNAGEPPTLSG